MKKDNKDNIFIKYDYLIKGALNNNITDIWNIDSIYEIKRYVEKEYNRTLPIDWNCEECIIYLILLFNKLKK